MEQLLKKQHFVLVHGAAHGTWCWVKVVPVLEKAGHRVTTVDLLSAGENRVVAAEDITSGEEYDTPLTALFELLPDQEKVILVGHSMGGMSISRMSEKYPKKISVAIYLAAFMLGVGKENSRIMKGFDLQGNLDLENPSSLPKTLEFTPENAKENFYQKCSHEDYIFARDRLRIFPTICLVPPNNLTLENYGSVPRIYVLARDDKVILPKNQRKMVELNPVDEFFEIEGDHSVFFSALESLTKILTNAAVKYGSS